MYDGFVVGTETISLAAAVTTVTLLPLVIVHSVVMLFIKCPQTVTLSPSSKTFEALNAAESRNKPELTNNVSVVLSFADAILYVNLPSANVGFDSIPTT